MKSPQFPKIALKENRKSRYLFTAASFCIAFLVFGIIFISACHKRKEGSMVHAVEAWDSGDYSTAAEEYEHFLQSYPTGEPSLEARFQLANVYYYNLKKYEQARVHYKEFLN